jgi:hypothetical protein
MRRQMATTIRVTCKHSAPEGWEWANSINKKFRAPIALIEGKEKRLNWDRATELRVAPGKQHKIQVFFRILDLHWCGAEADSEPLKEGETAEYLYHVEIDHPFVKHGHLDRTS